MKTNYSMIFYLKKPKNYEKGPVPIYMRVTVAGKRAETATGRECEPSRSNPSAGSVSGNKEDVKALNSYLNSLQATLLQAHGDLTKTGKLITAEVLKNKFLGKEEKPRLIMEIISDQK